MNSGIAPDHLDKISALFRKHSQIREAVLFGSRAKGNYREGSDIDVALKGHQVDSRVLAEIEAEYDTLYLPWKLDLIVYETIENSDLKDHIDRVGVSIL